MGTLAQAWGAASSSHGGRHRLAAAVPVQNAAVTPQQLLQLGALRDRKAIELRFLFANQAATIQEAAKNFLCRQQGTPDGKLASLHAQLADYIDKAVVLGDKFHLLQQEDEAWSGAAGTKSGCKEVSSR